jgi:hypothetical protein
LLLYKSTTKKKRKKKKEKFSSLLICTLQEQFFFSNELLFVEEKKHVKKKPSSRAIGDDGKGSIVIGVRSTKRWDWPPKKMLIEELEWDVHQYFFVKMPLMGL